MHAIFNQLENSRAYTMNWFDKSDGHKSLGPGQLPPILSGAREFLGAMIMEGLAGAGGGGEGRGAVYFTAVCYAMWPVIG